MVGRRTGASQDAVFLFYAIPVCLAGTPRLALKFA
jgi:hypothetical protein